LAAGGKLVTYAEKARHHRGAGGAGGGQEPERNPDGTWTPPYDMQGHRGGLSGLWARTTTGYWVQLGARSGNSYAVTRGRGIMDVVHDDKIDVVAYEPPEEEA